MFSTIVTKQYTRSCSVAVDVELSGIEEFIQKDGAKNSAIRKAKLAEQRNNSKKGESREPVIVLGTLAWDNMFGNDKVNIPKTEFMSQLKEAIMKEQLLQTTKDITAGIAERKEIFCKTNYKSIQDAEVQLPSSLK